MLKKVLKITGRSVLIFLAVATPLWLLLLTGVIPGTIFNINVILLLAIPAIALMVLLYIKPVAVQKKFLKIEGRVLLILLAIILLAWLLIQTELVQNFIIGKVTTRLSKELKTEIKIKHVSIELFNKMNLEGTLIKDRQKDTLLYAGALKVRITDWFFWKDKADLKYAGLEDAVIKMKRNDSVWNYQFIADYFTAPPSAKKSSKKTLELNLQKLDFKNVSFLLQDDWIGQRMVVKTGSLLMDADTIDLNKSIFKINEIDIDKPVFAIEDYDGLKPRLTTKKTVAKDTGMYFNAGDMLVKIDSIKITNGTFRHEVINNKKLDYYFDSHHIIANKLSGTISKFSFIKDTIKANINLSAKERSGFVLKKLKAQFRLTPQIMEFAKLDLRTNKSHIGDYYAMRFKDFNKDMADYEDKVIMNARFRRTEVNSDDVAYFAPALDTWKKQVELNGNFSGTVADFVIKDLFLRSGNDTYITGDITMNGLPDINKTIINFSNGNLQTDYNDFITVLPSMREINSPNLAALGKLRFTGNFSGTINDFATNGNISTAIGGVYANVNMKFPAKSEPQYKGTIITKQFNLGKFLNTSSIGMVSFKGKIAGSSFDIDKVQTSLDGTFDEFEFNNYTYTNLIFNGNIKNRFFNGEFKANDPNFDFTSNIEIDLTQDQPKFNVLGDLVKANLQSLKFTPDNFELTGLFDLNFQGRNIDEFIGAAKILNASLLHDSTRLSFDSLSLNSYVDSVNIKVLDIQSNEFDVRIRGNYKILDLPNTFQAFLNHYYPAYINPPKEKVKEQDFSVALTTRDFDKYAQVINAHLSGFDNAAITGNVITKDSGSFSFKASVPNFQYDKYKLENAVIEGKGDYRSMNLTGDIAKMYISDSTYFPNTKLHVTSQNDHSDVHVITSANNTLNQALLNADIYTLPDGVRINFQPSSFVVNEKKWDLEKQGEIVIRKNFASAQNVKFTQGFQEITVETEVEEGSNVSDLAVRLKNVNLGDFTPIITKEPRMEGIANGNIYLRDFYGDFRIDASLSAEQFRLNDDSVGIVNVKGLYVSKTGKITYEAKAVNEAYNFSAKGSYETKDSTGSPLYNSIQLTNARVGIVNEFLGNIFENIDGFATGNLIVSGDPSSPLLTGDISLKHAGLTVKYTRVHYTIDSAVFKFRDGFIDFGEFRIKDINNNTGIVKGKLYEKGFKDMQFDFDLSTNKLLLLNTTARDNQQFYGKAIGKANLSLKGPQENMRMIITGQVNDTTHIFIPTSNSKENADADFIVFKQYGREMETQASSEKTKLNIDLDITANNQAQIDVILDELTGDVIKATGNGRLQIKVPATGSMTMKGRYNIERGRYDFNFQSFIRKPFDLLPDAGNYIEWNGDPFNANIHIDAQYTASRVSVSDLLSTQSQDINGTIKGYRGDVYVIAGLRGKLSNPDINFHLDFPAGSAIKNDNDFSLFLTRLQSDDNEMLKQVTYLIVFGSFAPYGEARTSTNVTSLGLNTISQKLTAEINKLVSNLLYKITGDKSLQLDIGTSTYSSSTILNNGAGTSNNRLDRQTVNLKINQSLLDGKVIITFGGDLDFNLTNSTTAQTGNFQWLPDISVQIVLSQDRKLRAIVFNKSSLDIGQSATIGRRNRQGISLSYTRDFEKLFGTRQKDTTITPPASPPAASTQ